MWRPIVSILKATAYVVTVLSVSCVQGQQNIIADKDLTRPEINRNNHRSPAVVSISARMSNGYNDIQWTSVQEDATRKYIVEYSKNGIDFQTAGEVVANNRMVYTVRHSTFESGPLLYRLKMEDLDGRYTYSRYALLEGLTLSPVKIYPTIISGNAVNASAYFPVERVIVFNSSGQQVYAQDIGGRAELLNIPVPTLAKGMYWMVFYGRDWKTTEKFIVS
jgi:hypothetical protein